MRRMDGDVATAPTPPGGRRDSGSACTTLPRRMANVYGTSGAPLAFRLRNPGTYTVKYSKSPIGEDPDVVRLERIREDELERAKFAMKIQEQQRDQWNMVRAEIKKRVELGMEAYELDLEERRERLREVLVLEEAQLTRELVEASQRLEEERAAELEKQAAEAAAEAEEANLLLLHEKMLQRYSEQNAELQRARRRAWTEDTKSVNRVQIAEAEEMRRLERKDEEFWEELAAEHRRAADAAEAEKRRQRVEREQETARKLRDQMRERELRRSQIVPKFEPSALPIGRPDETEEERRAKQRRRREELDKQLAESKRCLSQRCREVVAIAEMSAVFARPQPGPDEVRRDKEVRLRETLAFMKNMEEFRAAIARREAEAENCARRLATEAELQRREKARRAKEEEARQNREAKLAWDRQLEDKRNRIRLELEAEKSQTLEKVPTAQELKAKRRLAAREYGRELMAQRDWIENRRSCETRQWESAIEQQLAERERWEEEMARELELRDSVRPHLCGAS